VLPELPSDTDKTPKKRGQLPPETTTTSSPSTTTVIDRTNNVIMIARAPQRERTPWLAQRRSMFETGSLVLDAGEGEDRAGRRNSISLRRVQNNPMARVSTNSETLPLKLEISKLTSQLEESTLKNEEFNKKIKQLTSDMEEKELAVKNLTQQFEGFKTQQLLNESTKDEKSKLFHRNQKKIKSLKKQVKELTNENTKLKLEIDTRNGGVEEAVITVTSPTSNTGAEIALEKMFQPPTDVPVVGEEKKDKLTRRPSGNAKDKKTKIVKTGEEKK